ncbi:MAG: hypothetical protein RJA70_2852 [Pseudomonadota bacterium]|jgi:hypothetical protein
MLNPNCQNFRARLQSEPDTDLESHVDNCEACQTWLDASLLGSSAESEGLQRLEATLSQQGALRGRLMSVPTALRARVLALVMLVLVTAQLMFAARADLGVYPMGRLALELGAHGLVLLLLVTILLRPAFRPDWPLTLTLRAAGLAVLVILGIALTNPAHALHAASLAGRGPDFGSHAAACLAYGTISGMSFVVLAALLDRGAPVGGTPRWGLHLLLTGLGIATSSLVLVLHCPIVHMDHLLVGHVLTVGPIALACGVLLRVLSASRAAPR